MDQYHVVNFIRKNPPRTKDPNELKIWYRQICHMFKNKMPLSVVQILTDLNNCTIDACILETWNRKTEQEAQIVKRYDAYIARREAGNAMAQAKR